MTENRKLPLFEENNDNDVIPGREREIGDDVPLSQPSKPFSEERIPIFYCFGEGIERLDPADISEPDQTLGREELFLGLQ